jgi:hypothetical protein
VQGKVISSNTEHQLAAVYFPGLLINTRGVLGKNIEVRVNKMKATMLIIIVGLAGPQTAEFDSMEACMKQAPIIEMQAAIKDVACIPSSNGSWININDYNNMLDGFLRMVDAIKEREEIWGEPHLNQHGNWEPVLTDPKHE